MMITLQGALMLLCLWTAAPTFADDDTLPKLEEIFEFPPLHGVRPSRAEMAADGSWAVYRWREDETEEHERDLWFVSPQSPQPTLLLQGDWANRQEDEDEDAPRRRHGWRGFVSIPPAGNHALIGHDGWLHRLHPGKKPRLEPLFSTGSGRPDIEWEKSGLVVWIRLDDRTLWRLDLTSGERAELSAQLPEEGRIRSLDVDHGLLVFAIPEKEKKPEPETVGAPPKQDKVELEEKGDTLTAGNVVQEAPKAKPEAGLYLYRFETKSYTRIPGVKDSDRVSPSADGKHFLIRDVQRESQRRLIMADYLTEQVTAVPVRSDIAGDPAPKVALEVSSIDGKRRAVALDRADRFFLRQMTWSEEGARCLIDRISDDWHVREIFVFDAEKESLKRLFGEYDEAWIGGPSLQSRWSQDGQRILFTSERSGWNQLSSVSIATGEVTALTQGEFELTWFDELENGQLFFSSNEADRAESHLYELLAPGQWKHLGTPRGYNSGFELSRDGRQAVFTHGDLGVPDELYTLDIEHGTEPVRMTHTIPAAWLNYAFTPPEIVNYANPNDDVSVRALLYKPANFDPTRRYPAVVFVHGAGYLQNVTRNLTRYAVNMSFHQRLANKGYLVLDPDYRHSKGYGRDFRADIYGWMGGKDLEDVVAGVGYLDSLGFVDVERVGLYGGSYGGFMTLMALFTEPDVFACGAALRSVTDWRTYNAWYTNPRLGDPERDAENYRLSSPIDHVEGLTKPLLVLHGMKDSNVFAQDSIRLIEKLIDLRKDFDAMLYPSQNHGFTDPDAWIDEYRRIERFFDRHLKPTLLPAGD